MIKRIVAWFFFIMLLLALMLYLNGVTHVEFNYGYTNFLRRIAYSYRDYEWIRIPSINELAYTTQDNTGILEVLQTIANSIIGFINLISTFVNFFLDIVFYVFALFTTLIKFKEIVVPPTT